MSILVTCLCRQAGAEAGKKPKLGNKMELLEVPFGISSTKNVSGIIEYGISRRSSGLFQKIL